MTNSRTASMLSASATVWITWSGPEHVRRDDVDSQFLGQTRDLRGRFLHQVANLGVGHWAQLGRMLSDNHELHLCLPFSWSSSRERRPEHTTTRARSRDLSGRARRLPHWYRRSASAFREGPGATRPWGVGLLHELREWDCLTITSAGHLAVIARSSTTPRIYEELLTNCVCTSAGIVL